MLLLLLLLLKTLPLPSPLLLLVSRGEANALGAVGNGGGYVLLLLLLLPSSVWLLKPAKVPAECSRVVSVSNSGANPTCGVKEWGKQRVVSCVCMCMFGCI